MKAAPGGLPQDRPRRLRFQAAATSDRLHLVMP
jgi:hypothetical protein